MTPDLQALLAQLTLTLAPSTSDHMNYGFPIQLTQAEARMLVDSLAEAERERDRALEFEGRAMRMLKENTQVLEAVAAERDAALTELAKLRAEAEWRPIDTMPKGEAIFMAATADGRIMIFRGSILANMIKRSTPDHLQFPAVAWKLLPSPPKDPAHD